MDERKQTQMRSGSATRTRPIRDVVRIGQVWEHHRPEYFIQIKQIHRADRLVEAWFDAPSGGESHGVTFADLQREYELVE